MKNYDWERVVDQYEFLFAKMAGLPVQEIDLNRIVTLESEEERSSVSRVASM
jgi:hypothetical protein